MGDDIQRTAPEATAAAPRAGWPTSGDPGAGGPMALRSALDRKPAVSQTAPHVAPRGTFDMAEASGAESDSPWDAEAAEALVRIYEAESQVAPVAKVSGASPAPRFTQKGAAAVAMAQPNPVADPTAHWLEDRFAEIASKVERSLAELQPERSLELLTGRFDDFESRMSAVLREVASSTDVGSLKLIEAHIEELARYAEAANTQFSRLDEIEGQLASVVDRLTRIEESDAGIESSQFGADLKALIDAAVERTAERFSAADGGAAAGDGASQAQRLDDLRGLIVTFMDDRRRGDEETAIALDTMQEAMIRVLDKVEALEHGKGGVGHPAANAVDAAPAAVPFGPPADFAPSLPGFAFGRSSEGDAAAIVAAAAEPARAGPPMQPEPTPVLKADAAGQPALAETAVVDPERGTQEVGTPAGRTIDRVRQDLIADARRAKQQADAAAAEAQKAARAKPTDRRKSVIADDKPAGRKLAVSRTTMIAAVLLLIAVPALLVAPRLLKRSAEPAATTTRTLQPKAAPAPAATPGEEQPQGETAPADAERRSDRSTQGGMAPPSQIGELPDMAPGILFANGDKTLSEEQIRRAYEQHTLAEQSSRLAGSAIHVTPAALSAEMPPPAASAGPASGDAAGKLDLPPANVGPLSLRTAAANGDASAQFEVGARLAEGKGVEQSFTEAARWYQRAAAQGFAQAQYRLATLYERGLGVKKDLARARAWYQRAAEAGNVKAMHNLAVLSAGRAGEAPDYQTASRWFERAAALGLADSQYNLAVLFENGLGVAQDNKRAYQWYALAARSGDKEALRKRDALKSELSVAEVAEIDRTIADWRAEASDRLANDPRAAGEDWKKRQGADANG